MRILNDFSLIILQKNIKKNLYIYEIFQGNKEENTIIFKVYDKVMDMIFENNPSECKDENDENLDNDLEKIFEAIQLL